MWSTGGIVLLLLVLSWLYDKFLITPLTKLSKSLTMIDASPDCRVELPAISGNDELANLAQCINNMLINLDKRQMALQESEFRWKFAIEGSGDGVWDWNIQTDEAQYSIRWKAMIGYDDKDILPTYGEWINKIHPDDQLSVKNSIQAYLDGITEIYLVEYRLRCKDDSFKWILSRGMIVSRSEDGKPLRMIGTHTDISYRKQSEQELKIAATAFESQEGIFITDTNNNILRVNRAFTRITGYSAEEAMGKNPSIFNSGRQDENFYELMWKTIRKTNSWQGEVWNQRKNREIYPENLTITAVKDAHGIITNYVATLNDITISKAASEEIKNLAFYDTLTNLPNRRLLQDRLRQALVASSRSSRGGALLFLDIDYFKTLNDTLGHDVGDLLLQQVAKRLTDCTREGDTVARIGGDEFVLLLEGLSEKTIEAATQT